ncbi:unnamed protein product [Protopolystoma xenopodis]|uniref:Uncharacterized protein n=1 Tax=Protopolystoma xenopodis TaxID=117903 RepID=A0A3S5CJ53_9PLAT|nr:unnamed protein product [Protopolystoma xenopodis]
MHILQFYILNFLPPVAVPHPAVALKVLYDLNDDDTCTMARRGSGSACRSMFGGCVRWSPQPSASTSIRSLPAVSNHRSIVEQLFPETHWPELRIIICVTDRRNKMMPSTYGMKQTVATSFLYNSGRAICAEARATKVEHALKERDFHSLAKLVMRDSNQLAALCMDTWPPCLYLSPASFDFIRWVHAVNTNLGRTAVIHTF